MAPCPSLLLLLLLLVWAQGAPLPWRQQHSRGLLGGCSKGHLLLLQWLGHSQELLDALAVLVLLQLELVVLCLQAKQALALLKQELLGVTQRLAVCAGVQEGGAGWYIA
jgi:hypothetical protein